MTARLNYRNPQRCDRKTCPAKRVHDTYAANRVGCRSEAARVDAQRYRKQWKAGVKLRSWLPRLPYVRMLRALAAQGWPATEVARRTGLHLGVIRVITRDTDGATLIERRSAHAIRAVYAELWDKPGPSAHTRARSLAKGWVTAAAWDSRDLSDETETPKPDAAVDQFAVAREREFEVERRTGWGHSAPAIAEALVVTERTVVRIRERLGITAPDPAAGEVEAS